MRDIRFGVVGCGLMGREFASAAARWLHLLDMPARPVIVAVSDPNPGARSWFVDNVPSVELASESHAEVLAHGVEAVYVAVPHHLHEPIYRDCLEADVHLFAEKPFGIDLKAAESIMAASSTHPRALVRCSSEFPFYSAVKRVVAMVEQEEFGEVIEARFSFRHSSDLNPDKPINWKRQTQFNGEYGCMGDLGLHVCHIPFRFGWMPRNVRALLSNIVRQRPDGSGGMAECDTWDNAVLACESVQGFPLILETKRISPGDMNTWSARIHGTRASAEFSTKHPKTLKVLRTEAGKPQAWTHEDVGYDSYHRAITGPIFEFGFTDAILQMWASFLTELAGEKPPFRCATTEEALWSHRLFTAALESNRTGGTVAVG